MTRQRRPNVRPIESTAAQVEFTPGGRARLIALGEKLMSEGIDEETVALLVDHVENADDFALSRIRPYRLADEQRPAAPQMLEACLQATRAGMLDLQWNLICPMCRGGEAKDSLAELSSKVHCDGCNIDFNVNFEQSIELTFRPNPSIRQINVETFCVGGPQVTPHIAAQQFLKPQSRRSIDIQLEEGRYRLRTTGLPGWQHVSVTDKGLCGASLCASPEGWSNGEVELSKSCSLELENALDDEQLFIWSGPRGRMKPRPPPR